jgi:phosphoribosylanthranilate isomerase
MKKFIRQVTCTGADDSTNYHRLFELSEKYPFVEWGILLSKNSEGYPRFPRWNWIEGFLSEKPPYVKCSGHLCGTWVKDIISGGTMFLDAHPELAKEFNRFQLNFHGQSHYPHYVEKYLDSLKFLTGLENRQIIFQMDGVNKSAYHFARSNYGRQKGLYAVALHDISGGSGILPEDWPLPMGDYCGYAGGLSPDNLEEQLNLIEKRIRNLDGSLYPIWIDAETHLRPSDNSTFDLVLVERFLKTAKRYVL